MRLDSKTLNEYRIKLSQLSIYQPIIHENGVFEFYNINSEYDKNRLVRLLKQLDFVEEVQSTDSGYNFNHFTFNRGFAEPTKKYNIRGRLKESLIEAKQKQKYIYEGPVFRFGNYLGDISLETLAVSDKQAINNFKFKAADYFGYDRAAGANIDINSKLVQKIEAEEPEQKEDVKYCDSCGRRLNDAGECPLCDLNDESVLDENYKIDFDEVKNGHAGYILPDGSLSVTGIKDDPDAEENYHGSDSDEDARKGYPEFSNTHYEDDTCIRLYTEPNEAQYKSIEKIIDIFLDDVSYTKVEIWKDKHPIYYKVFSLYEDACEDYSSPTEQLIGNWTGYDIIKIIKDCFLNKINESKKIFEDIEKHEELNPILWENGKLKPEVREKILEIVKDFTDGLEEDGIKFNLKDIKLVGSNCSYNYNKDSDLDIHLVMDTQSLHCPDNLYPLLYSAYRSIWNKNHDIDFYGIPVEIFIETTDMEEPIKEE